MSDFGKPFTEDEDKNLLKLHDEDNLTIVEIAEKMDSSPIRIIYRLLENNYLVESIRGFTEYSKTKEYNDCMQDIVLHYETDENKI